MAGRSAATSRPVALFTVAVTGLIGVGMLLIGATRAEGRTLNLVLGAFMTSVAVMVALGQRRDRMGWRATELDGRPAWGLPVGAGPMVPAVAAVLTTLGVGCALAAVSGVGPALAAALGLVAIFLLVLALEFWRLVRRRPELLLSADLIRFRGPGIDAELGWEDVGRVDYEHLGTRWGAVVALAAADATTYAAQRRRLLVPMDRSPAPPGIHVRTGLLPDAAGLRRLLRAMHAQGRDARVSMISRGLPADSGH